MKKDGKINKKYVVGGLVLVILVLYFIFGGGSNGVGTYTVAKADVSQSAVLSGTVSTTDKADLGFAAGGRVARISVTNNQKVTRGQVLAQLEIGDLLADLKIKQANYKTSDLDLESDVESKYRTLLSDDLTFTPEDETSTVEPPSIGGIYTGTEGRYKVIIRSDDVNRTNYDLYTFDLEKTKRELNKTAPTPLGTKGLYISFDDSDLTGYDETVWYIDIPNKSGASYVANFNAYTEAKKRLESADKSANDSISALAAAEIQKINAEIRKNTIYAPFNGRVTNIEKEVGESASLGERVVSILGENTLEVILQVSELDVSRIVENSPIEITLDAFSGETFMGTLKTINSRDTEVEGVPVYEAFVELPADVRIKTGMSAKGEIVFANKSDVLAIPSYLVDSSSGVDTVQVVGLDGKAETRVVTLGLRGSDSMVEIISGLQEGEKILSNTDEK